jgi:two-component system sensor histidine kinase FlrB
VQRELSDTLTRELRPSPEGDAGPPASSYAEIVEAVTRRLDPLAATRGVRLEVGDLEAGRTVSPAHADNVSHAVFNVLENALVAAHASVQVSIGRREGRLVISVADDGPGMRPSVLARAAQPFVTTKTDGTGMGLAIARAAAEGEGGRLSLGDGQGGGCRVEIDVPASG